MSAQSERVSGEARRPTNRAFLRLLPGFAVFGLLFGVWQVLLTDLSRELKLSPGPLGFAISVGFVASFPMMIFAGGVVDKWGQRNVAAISGTSLGLSFASFAFIPNYFILIVLLVAFFGASGVYDVGINAAAMALEQRSARHVLPLFHAGFSGGAVVGALGAGGLLALGVDFRWFYPSVCGLVWLVSLIAWFDSSRGTRVPKKIIERRNGLRLFRVRSLLVIAFIVGLAFLLEGIMETWSVVYLRSTLGLTAIVGALGGAVFHLAMMVGRLSAAGLIVRLGRVNYLKTTGMVAALGMLLALVTAREPLVLAGFLVVGLALAGVAPIAFSLAGDLVPGRTGEASAVLTTIGYAGFLIGPALLGGLAEVTGLRVALLMAAVAGLAITLLARSIRPLSVPASQA
ncbi:MAG: MFS transporter [Chloroflexota bacterium]|nr:MFS transporter [Chloroflexota bacterium]